MKKNKGFTLIELAGIVTLISIVALASFVAISNMLKNSDVETKEKNIAIIKEAAEVYFINDSNKINQLHQTGEYVLTVEELLNNGLIKKIVIKNDIKLTSTIKITNSATGYVYDFLSN